MCVNAPFRYFMDIQRFRGTNPLVPIKKACWLEQTALQGNKQNTALQFFTIIIDVHFSYHIMFKGVFVLELAALFMCANDRNFALFFDGIGKDVSDKSI